MSDEQRAQTADGAPSDIGQSRTPPEFAEAEFERLIDELEQILANASRVPFSRRLMIEEDDILDVIDRMRVAVPDEIRQARHIVRERDQLLESTKKKIAHTLSEQGLLEVAQRERAKIVGEAEAEASRIRAEADDYSRQVLLDLEERVGKALLIIQNGLEELGVT